MQLYTAIMSREERSQFIKDAVGFYLKHLEIIEKDISK